MELNTRTVMTAIFLLIWVVSMGGCFYIGVAVLSPKVSTTVFWVYIFYSLFLGGFLLWLGWWVIHRAGER